MFDGGYKGGIKRCATSTLRPKPQATENQRISCYDLESTLDVVNMINYSSLCPSVNTPKKMYKLKLDVGFMNYIRKRFCRQKITFY